MSKAQSRQAAILESEFREVPNYAGQFRQQYVEALAQD